MAVNTSRKSSEMAVNTSQKSSEIAASTSRKSSEMAVNTCETVIRSSGIKETMRLVGGTNGSEQSLDEMSQIKESVSITKQTVGRIDKLKRPTGRGCYL